ncbi:MAG: primosomal protein N' [Treponemataceae bacterium]
MEFLEVVFNLPIRSTFFYKNCDVNISGFGKRVSAYFGKRKLVGFVIGESEVLPKDFPAEIEVREIERFVDTEILFTKTQVILAKEIASFYICTLGEVLSCMLPSAKREKSLDSFGLSSVEFSKKNFSLSQEQARAVEEIKLALNKGTQAFFYLFGITGSGKTEVYLNGIELALEQGKSAIYLVPEIALTHQTSEELVKRFGSKVAVLHSGLTASKKLSEWRRCLTGEAKVVVGARSAIFAPVQNLGLIIIDEEHDSSYKAGSTPRYHARQVAMMLSGILACPLVMGSATPSVEAWHSMQTGIIKKLELTKRLAGGTPPKIKIVSMQGQKGSLSQTLIAEMKETKAQEKQSIIFLNRRGFAHFYFCHSCGYQMLCKNCSVSMTWHKKEGVMKCHYCGWQSAPPHKCPDCGSLEAGYAGFGTEFIENEIKRFLPECELARVDTDSVNKKGALEKKLKLFREKKIDILLGTQMVAKGLNFPEVKLVGIAMADTSLQMPDFRATERTFALITQVAGRAGRFMPDGRVIIQTLRPTHPAIIFAKEANLEEFYELELVHRRQFSYPPFARLLRIVFRSKSKTKAVKASQEVTHFLKQRLPKTAELLGPAECVLSMVAGNYREQILLKNKTIRPLQNLVSALVENFKLSNGVYMEIDVDPVSLL